MSRDFEELDYRPTPMGDLTLRRRRLPMLDNLEVFEVKLGEAFLMSSLFHEVEVALSVLGLKDLPAPLDVVVGGLGLGYTAVAALKHDTVSSLLVVDTMEAVIEWHQRGIVPLGPILTSDPRCRLVHGDFFAMAAAPAAGFDPLSPARRFHAVLLDIDHSPTNLLHPRHGAFYSPEGLALLASHLHPGGVFGLWSDDPPSTEFTDALRAVFAEVESHIVTFHNPLLDTESASTVYVARKSKALSKSDVTPPEDIPALTSPQPTNSFAAPIFKGWVKPGPIPPGAQGQGPHIEAGETLDAISGYFRLFQLSDGHRFSTDDVLTAWYGTSQSPSARTVLDLGSGVGTVGMIAAWRLQGARFVTVEAQDESVRLARKSAQWNGLTDRYEIRQGDFRDPGILSAAETFDLILGSPPYFPIGSGPEGDHPQKIACRFELRGTVADYCATAAKHLAPGGFFACVFPIQPEDQRQRVIAGAAAAGLTIIRWRPIILREDAAPLLALFGLMRATDLPEKIRNQSLPEPPLTIRQRDGTVTPEYIATKLSFGFPP